MDEKKARQESVEKLRALIEDTEFAMLTTVDQDGSLRSRPMATQQVEFDGDLWFFTASDSGKVDEITENHAVNVAYAVPNKQRYVSVSGTAKIVRDRKKMESLWQPVYKAYFPEGLSDPKLVLLKVHVDSAEYWDSPGGRVVQLLGFVKALATGKNADEIGDHGSINLTKDVKKE